MRFFTAKCSCSSSIPCVPEIRTFAADKKDKIHAKSFNSCQKLSRNLFAFDCRELREQITPEIMELIKQQRLNYLVEGTRFTKYSKGQRMKGEMLITIFRKCCSEISLTLHNQINASITNRFLRLQANFGTVGCH